MVKHLSFVVLKPWVSFTQELVYLLTASPNCSFRISGELLALLAANKDNAIFISSLKVSAVLKLGLDISG